MPLPFAVLLCGLALGAPSGGVALQAAATPPGPATSPAPGPAATPAGVGWVLPLGEGTRVARPFDPPPTPYAAGHRGVDLLAVPGAAVRAAAGGWSPSRGCWPGAGW